MTDFHDAIDLASERLGGSVLHATDDFFAAKENLVRAAAPVWKEHEYTDRGKWMDGWESRRKRTPGHDSAIVRLGAPGIVQGIVVDTSFFRGNYPAECSIEGCFAAPESAIEWLESDAEWIEILPKSPLSGDSQNEFPISNPVAFTHVRLHIYPDGGVARLRVHGQVVADWHREGGLSNEHDLAIATHGGRVLSCSDAFFGPKHNLIMPMPAAGMSDGWETRRRRGPGHDWVVVELACEAVVRRLEIDTAHFKGNYPDTCSVDVKSADGEWSELLPRTKLLPDTRHLFVDELLAAGPATHVRLNAYPDGGVARLRVYGRATEDGRGFAVMQHINSRTRSALERELFRCCASMPWVQTMIDTRPFPSWDAVHVMADRIWWSLDQTEWLEAFAAHPRIGESGGGSWSASEQSGMDEAEDETRAALVQANRDYEDRFGHIFIVCATGKDAGEMLRLVRERIWNDPVDELRVAAEEQRKIMQLRLMKLVE